jgi:general secretion pathway protein D
MIPAEPGVAAKTRRACRFEQVFASVPGARVIRLLDFFRHRTPRAATVWILTALLVIGAGATTPARAADAPVTLNFVNADIDAVIKAVAEITGRNFIVDPRVKGTINIVSARPVPVSLVYPTLLSALRLQGFAAIESDGMVKIVPEAEAKQQGGPVVTGSPAASGDRLVTQVITLKYESAAQLVNILRPLITANNTIAAYPAANALIITDYADNLKRIDRVVATLDQPPSDEPVIIPVKYASALDLVTVLAKLTAPTPGAVADIQQQVTLVADPRSNSIIVRSENNGRVARVRQLIEQLDTPGRAGGNIFIIYLKNADATRVAATLRSLFAGGGEVAATGGTSLAGTAGGLRPVAAAAAAALSPASSAPGSAVGFSTGGVSIQADPANNALIIQAPEPVYNNLRAIIEKLDIRRAQVYVEALIVEVSADKAAQFGIQWQALTGIDKNGWQGIGGTNFGARGSGSNIIDIATNPGTTGPGLNIGIINGTVTIPGLGEVLNLAFLARALQSDANANILSTPALLTLDNEEAKIVVGQNVPFITGQYAQTGTSSSVTPFQTIERKDVGLTLRVRPQITEGGSIRLELYQEVSRVDNTSNPAGIITNKRSLESSVTVDDGQIVVLGGLITDTMTDNTDKVPLIGDLPLLGGLFRYDTRQRVKTNLMVFLKPTVVRGAHGADALTQDRYDYLKAEQQRMNPPERVFWNDTTRPELRFPTPLSITPLVPPLPSPATLLPPSEPPRPPSEPQRPAPEAPAPAKPPG